MSRRKRDDSPVEFLSWSRWEYDPPLRFAIRPSAVQGVVDLQEDLATDDRDYDLPRRVVIHTRSHGSCIAAESYDNVMFKLFGKTKVENFKTKLP